ncbi:hepatocyte growth factor activator isoform X2 [Rhinatrema bivittatum]|uniref:hepatocyte growth factor activator isoform X2 n=1 Tax=Rhinatrema bivittatum TaxID=194408 RepID=UPI00112B572D|nr:hepatocyte growth factor activator isoform X2 [Rhinatrema bivittatum]
MRAGAFLLLTLLYDFSSVTGRVHRMGFLGHGAGRMHTSEHEASHNRNCCMGSRARSGYPGGTFFLEGPLGFTEDGKPCTFPFRYKGRMHYSCTSNLFSLKKWCATTHNYDRDKEWGYCAPLISEKIDHCARNPCRNGGTCLNTADWSTYHCMCLEEYTGKDCETAKCFDPTYYTYFNIGEMWPRFHRGEVEQCSCTNGTIECYPERSTDCIENLCMHDGVCRMIISTGETVCGCRRWYVGKYCNIDATQKCYISNNAAGYRGTVKTTLSGHHCMRWNSDLLYQELHVDSIENAVQRGVGSHPYCRSPDDDDTPWCYVMKAHHMSWEYCNISVCTSLSRNVNPFSDLPEINTFAIMPKPTCGTKHAKRVYARGRILGGTSALPASHPWLAAVYIGNNFCAGSLILPCWVVSAAHCFATSPKKSTVTVILGQHFFNTTTDVTQSFEIDRYILYDKYSLFDPTNHDIVLIKLKKKGNHCAKKTQFVQPICLPGPNISFPDQHMCQIAGWGHMHENETEYANHLQEAIVPLLPDHMCHSPEVYGAEITDSMFCAGYFDCRTDACQGDSGGPLACEKDKISYLYGIISWGDGCGRFNKPGVYTRVSNYVDWINGKIKPKPANPAT